MLVGLVIGPVLFTHRPPPSEFHAESVMERKEPDMGANFFSLLSSSFLPFSRACSLSSLHLANISPMCAHSQRCS